MSKDNRTTHSEKTVDQGADNVVPYPRNPHIDEPPPDVEPGPGRGGPRPPHYRRSLLQLIDAALVRNTNAHRAASKEGEEAALRTTIASAISTVVLSVMSTWDGAKQGFEQTPVASLISYNAVLILMGVAWACFGLKWIIQRFDGRAHAHKSAADAFSTLRRDALQVLAEYSISAEAVRRIFDQYSLIGRLCPMVKPSLWKKFDDGGAIDRQIQRLFTLNMTHKPAI
jgi:hypothetical protein